MSAFDGTIKSDFDLKIDRMLETLFQEHQLTPLEVLRHFPVFARRQHLKRFLAHTELFRLTAEVPGDIAELGVFRGLGLFTWANLLEAYAIGNRTKTVYGFDNWRGFEGLAPQDGPPDPHMQRTASGYSPAQYRKIVDTAIQVFDSDRFVPQKARIRLIDGDIKETVPLFLRDNPGVRFSLIHFDCDLYEPTKAALDAMWPRVVSGGMVLFDEYAIKEWPGETAAVDEFLQCHEGLKLRTLSWTNSPAAYLMKP